MNRIAVVAGISLAIGLGAGSLDAQEEEYRDPACELDVGHFLVRSATTYLKGATEEVDPNQRAQLLADAERNLLEAISTDQAENPAVWYFLARYYLLASDPAGADSAFEKTLAAVPTCAEDITYYRQSTWVRSINRGIDSLRAGDYEGARAEFRDANAIYGESNVGYFYLASLFADEGESDSALYYYKMVADIGAADTSHLDNYNTAVENIATLHHMLAQDFSDPEQWDSTITWYQKVRELDPGNTEALFGMAEAYAETGNQAQAVMIYDSVLANPDAMQDVDLFNAGVKLFNADEFDRAIRAFELGLEKNANHRDALFNLANTYLMIAQDAGRPQAARASALRSMDQVTHRLVAIDPKNREVYRVLAAAHQLQEMDDSTRTIMGQMDALTYEVVVDLSRPSDGGYIVAGRVVNLKEAQTNVPNLVFEFLDTSGAVVATDTIEAQSLASKASARFTFNQGEGVVAWRYRAGS